MSHQVLARKWRPQTFEEMVGQEHVLKALINGLKREQIHHGYLFTGTRGVGKTTLGRILAKCLNCEAGVTATPCGKCLFCTEIAAGRFADLIEVDAASRSGVDATRSLLENAQYSPAVGRYKVYLIDEVHMLSNASFNALLKTLEEPPGHVIFLLATTDPQKVPATVLSRCLQFNLKNLSAEQVAGQLRHVLDSEGLECEEGAVWQLALAARGSMRDGLTLTDQAVAFGAGRVLEAEVNQMLGSIGQEDVSVLVEALAVQDAVALLKHLQRMGEHDPDCAAVLDSVLSMLHRITLAQMAPDVLDNSRGDRKRVLELAQRMAPEEVQLFYQLGLVARRDLGLAPNPWEGLEMALLRMLAFAPATGNEGAKTPSAVPDATGKTQSADQGEPVKPASAEQAVAPVGTDDTDPALANLSTFTEEDWLQLYRHLDLDGRTRQLLSNCELVCGKPGGLRLRLSRECFDSIDSDCRARIDRALSAHFKSAVSAEFEFGETRGRLPVQMEQVERETCLRNAEATIAGDSGFRLLQEKFGATIVANTARLDSPANLTGQGIAAGRDA